MKIDELTQRITELEKLHQSHAEAVSERFISLEDHLKSELSNLTKIVDNI
jgi:hypothetical protein